MKFLRLKIFADLIGHENFFHEISIYPGAEFAKTTIELKVFAGQKFHQAQPPLHYESIGE